MEKNLPIVIPPIIGYTFHAYPLSIVLNDKNCLPWFHNNYIQLVCNPGFEYVFFDFCTLSSIVYDDLWIDSIYPGIPWINRNSIEEYILIDCNIKINELIISALKNDNYVLFSIDEFFIPCSSNYNINHYFHETLIYGFNEEKLYFNILAYNNQRQFSKDKIDFNVLRESFESFISKNYHDPKFTETYYNPVRFLKINKHYSYDFNLALVRDLLKDYINSQNSYKILSTIRKLNNNFVYGISVYGMLKKYFKLVLEGTKNIDVRPTCILWEHKKCMIMRLEYILQLYNNAININYIYTEYVEIEQKCLVLHKTAVKYSISKKPAIIKNIICNIDNIYNEEKNIIVRLIDAIDDLLH